MKIKQSHVTDRLCFRETSVHMDDVVYGRTATELMVYMDGLKSAVQEELHVIMLDGRMKVRGAYMVGRGATNGVNTLPVDVLRPVVVSGCIRFVLVHNHPAGNPTPSVEDLQFTRKIVEAAKVLGLQLLDHIVIATDGSVSMREQNLVDF